MAISVVIPALNEEGNIGLIAAVPPDDAGSDDGLPLNSRPGIGVN